jgi:Cys-tRNA(Pro)/Cys-tRNA(Cys) deacylase
MGNKQATLAFDVAAKAGVWHAAHHYEHDPARESYGLEAAEKLGVEPARVFKTLVVATPTGLAVAVVPVEHQLDLKAMATALKVKSVSLADQAVAERTTGYVAGGISPLGQKKRLPTVVDESATAHETVHVSGGKRGLEIELSPHDLVQLTNATVAAIAR